MRGQSFITFPSIELAQDALVCFNLISLCLFDFNLFRVLQSYCIFDYLRRCFCKLQFVQNINVSTNNSRVPEENLEISQITKNDIAVSQCSYFILTSRSPVNFTHEFSELQIDSRLLKNRRTGEKKVPPFVLKIMSNILLNLYINITFFFFICKAYPYLIYNLIHF